MEVKLTPQEKNIVDYLTSRSEVKIEELAQFSKNPLSVKTKTLQKSISDIKRKYSVANVPLPFSCTFLKSEADIQAKKEPEPVIQLRKTVGGNMVNANENILDAHVDFKIDRIWKQVLTRYGKINLSDNEWELFCLLHSNAEKQVSLEVIKNTLYKNFGSKTPANWSEVIARTFTKLRKNIPELKTQNRLLTMIGANETFYMLR
ncbi:MAG: hypothetical protein LC122_02575 [Chitinophagales bacterium]|nr:hypothetical protein [Chitinophagales bacterium]